MRAVVGTGVVLLAAALLASTASGADWPDQRLDAAAAQVAGHPVSVWCENSWADWLAVAPADDGRDGFTRFDTPIVYLSPQQCQTLHLILDGEDVGTVYASLALLTLAHEAVHQRGVIDEAATECAALPLVPVLATGFFGVAATVSQSYTAIVRRRIARRIVRVPVLRRRPIANPWLARLTGDARRWHQAKPPAYQGGC